MLHKVYVFSSVAPENALIKHTYSNCKYSQFQRKFQRKVGRHTSPYCSLTNTDRPPITIIQIPIWSLVSFPQRKIEYAGIALSQHWVIFLLTEFYRGWLHFTVAKN